MHRIWTQYARALERRPVLTKSITCGVLSLGVDLICKRCFPAPVGQQQQKVSPSSIPAEAMAQKQQQRKGADAVTEREQELLVVREESLSFLSSLDWERSTKFTVLGVFYIAPTLHVWYGYLNRVVKGTGLTGTMVRLALDQLVFAPSFIALFFALALLLEGRPEQIVDKLKQDWATTVGANLALWVPSMFFNFRYVPPHLQVLFSNGIGFFWNIYLSFTVAKGEATDKKIEEQVEKAEEK